MHETVLEHPDAGMAPVAGRAALAWPPPGLEPVHGGLWRAVTLLLAGGALVVMPLLPAVATPAAIGSAGPFGTGWWLVAAVVVAGLFTLLAGIDALARTLFAAARGVQSGYDGALVLYVASDKARDGGLLLQGLRHYSLLAPGEREWLLVARAVAAVMWTAAAVWLPAAFAGGAAAASRGMLASGGALTAFVLIPPLLLLLAGLGCRLLDRVVSGGARRKWRRNGNASTHLDLEAAEWRSELGARTDRDASGQTGRAYFRPAAWTTIGAGLLLPLPLLTLLLTASAGPAVMDVMVPAFGNTMARRLAHAELLRQYALQADPSITAREAGEALHALASVGRDPARRHAAELAPVRSYPPRRASAATPPEPLPPLDRLAGSGTIGRAWAGGLSAGELAFLDEVVAHPAHVEMAVVARAETLDVPGTRWDPAALAGLAFWELPLPPFGQLRQAGYARVASAVLHAGRRDAAAAETALREVISAGVLLVRDGVTLVDVMAGASLAEAGSVALAELYAATGRDAEVAALAGARQALDAAAAVGRPLQNNTGPPASLHGAMGIVTDDALPRGLRWEALGSVSHAAGCLNAHSAVFGRGEAWSQWLADARASLVRHPSEDALFDRITGPLPIPAEYQRRANLFRRLTGFTLRPDAAADCAALATIGTTSF